MGQLKFSGSWAALSPTWRRAADLDPVSAGWLQPRRPRVARRPTTLAALSLLPPEASLRLADALSPVSLVTDTEPGREEDDVIPQTWEFHDLLIHGRSRRLGPVRSTRRPASESFPNFRSPTGSPNPVSWCFPRSTSSQ